MSPVPDRAEAVRKYFIKTPIKPTEPDYSESTQRMALAGGALVLALILIFIGKWWSWLLGLGAGYYGFTDLKKWWQINSNQKKRYADEMNKYKRDFEEAEPKPSDRQMDEWLDGDIQNVIEEAKRRLDIDEDDVANKGRTPLLIGGPAEGGNTKFARGKDGKTRYSQFNALVVFLTEYHVATYQAIVEMEHGQIMHDNTKEFPYREITNLGTQTSKTLVRLVNYEVDSESGMQEFTLATSGANVIQVAYQFARSKDFTGELKQIGQGEETIRAIRKKLQTTSRRQSAERKIFNRLNWNGLVYYNFPVHLRMKIPIGVVLRNVRLNSGRPSRNIRTR